MKQKKKKQKKNKRRRGTVAAQRGVSGGLGSGTVCGTEAAVAVVVGS